MSVAWIPTSSTEVHLEDLSMGIMRQGEMLMGFGDVWMVTGWNGERLTCGPIADVYEWLRARDEEFNRRDP